ncbi:MAG: M56 family metallopeptidase [Akkermansiaceae bacterium]
MNIALTSLVISLLASGCVWAMGRRDPGGKPWLTVICLLVLLMIPVLTFLPKWHLDLLGSVSGVAPVQGGVSWWFIAWSGGVAVMSLRVISSHIALRKWVGDSRPSENRAWQKIMRDSAAMLCLRTLPELRVKSGLSSPVVTGLKHPVILVPENARGWSEETFQMAIIHEMGHLQRKDLWLRYAADIACAFHWYNPLVWWMRAKLLSQCEYACDARVIATGVDAKAYVRALCDVVENAISRPDISVRPAGVCAMADHAPLEVRVSRLMSGKRAGKPWLAVAAAMLTTCTALGLTLMRPAVERGSGGGESEIEYSKDEIDLRHSADPFPGN